MTNPFSNRKLLAGLSLGLLAALLAVVCLSPAGLPPSVSIAHLGYTNGVAPYALLAITNCSDSEIVLDSTCLVKYLPKQDSALRRVTTIQPNQLRVTRLLPKDGFVQPVFVFPDSQGEWQFECSVAYKSGWPAIRRFAEGQVRKLLRRARQPSSGKGWHKFDTEWLSCPSN